MSVCSYSFLLALGLAAILWELLPWQIARRLFLTCLNLAFLVTLAMTLVPPEPDRLRAWTVSWVCLGGFVLGSYGALRFLKARPSRDHVIALIGLMVCVFLYLKRYEFLNWLIPESFAPDRVLPNVEIIGLSYILFKAIHVAVDQWEGQLAPYGLLSYLNYQFAFFTFLSGPIQRYNDFQKSWEHLELGPSDSRERLRYWRRILLGMLQMGLVAVLLLKVFEGAAPLMLKADAGQALQGLAGRFYIYPLYLYFNFCGYTNIAIGSAGLLGFRVPENFNHPFVARNMIDFWTRWHITLSRWIRDYVFMTSYKACAERIPRWSRLCGYVLLFLALLIAGVWHGTTFAFVAFGVAHGVGIMLAQIYSDLLRNGLDRVRLQRYMQNRLIHAAAVLITFHYVCFTFLFFSSGIADTWFWLQTAGGLLAAPRAILATLQLNWWTGGGALALILLALGWWNGNRLAAAMNGLTARLPRSTGMLYAAVCSMVVLTTFVLLATWALQQKDPVVVYMRF
jgi:D-alanyl-lipoteichoic acid acyltransferase DltB (MBOAT superfamily)